jgi:ABC-type spermidine/putrescine transport system permease subunit II
MRASTSASNAIFTGVSVRIALPLVFLLRVSLRAAAFGRGLISTGLAWYRFLSEDERLMVKPDAEG